MEEWFKVILALLILIGPAVSRVIEKRLASAGKPDAARRMGQLGKMLENGDDDDKSEPFPEIAIDCKAETVPAEIKEPVLEYSQPALSKDLAEGGYKSIRDIMSERHGKAGLVSKETYGEKPGGRRGMKIDPEKLIIYSEIMKPKF